MSQNLEENVKDGSNIPASEGRGLSIGSGSRENVAEDDVIHEGCVID